jgi:hypothetical protein
MITKEKVNVEISRDLAEKLRDEANVLTDFLNMCIGAHFYGFVKDLEGISESLNAVVDAVDWEEAEAERSSL